MKYGEVIQDLAVRGFNWRLYDENFRFLRQTQLSSFPWSGIHWELWMRAQHSNIGKPRSTPGHPKSSEQSTPKGYCFKFHKGVQCAAGCAFKHLCYKCNGPHQASRCNFRSQNKNSVNQPLPAKSLPSKP